MTSLHWGPVGSVVRMTWCFNTGMYYWCCFRKMGAGGGGENDIGCAGHALREGNLN